MKIIRPGVFITFFLIHTVFSFGQKKPNIIYIMADDMGYADLSCYGRKDYQTPNLDKLASEGVKFMNAYAAAPVCTPTRVAFITGRYPSRIEVGLHEPLDWSSKDSIIGLTPEFPSVATLLKENGYNTYLVGKWHLGFKTEFNPLKNGFDYFFGFHGGAIDYLSHNDPKGNNDLYENYSPLKRDGYLTDIWADKAVEIINKPHSKPFFLAIMFNAPHWPWQGPKDKPYPDTTEWKTGGSTGIYAAMMISLDNAVGSILKALDEKQLTKNTLVIFTSDNGGERYSDNGIYKGIKMQLWEGGIREPAFIRWPGKIKANTTTNQVATTMDWTATILATSGTKAKVKFPLDGINLMDIISGKKKEVDRTLYWRISQRRKNDAMRYGKWKYLKDEKGNEYLFDLSIDPTEKNNLKETKVQMFNELKHKYQLWETTVLKPLPLQSKE
ncbi:MAG: sulfatase-like hydrolase/transferase [Ferruginibacter sp.]